LFVPTVELIIGQKGELMMVFLLIAFLLDEAVGAQLPPDPTSVTADQHRHFETEIRPLLHEHCLKCHGPTKQWAGLRLDSRAAILTGGDSGPAAVSGDAESSLLIRAIRHVDENLKMQEEKLSDDQIRLLTEWINSGIVFPENSPAETRRRDPNHWAFLPPAPVPVPNVEGLHAAEWAQSDLDRFILAKLAANNLTPAPRADKQTLIRRVTFDLTGLPPTPEETAAFLADDTPAAFSKLVDRLLDSPAYGERWGRHWLDVARYADSNGLDENVAFGNAWRYRDYVVNSFNSDKSFERFIKEQLAGDLLETKSPEERDECLVATGFLSIGPKVLAEVNMPKMRMDIVDEQIDTFGRVFLGMTFGCARCHDHKFDPVDTADYYGLAGIFKSTKTMETYTKVARWHEHPVKATEAAAMQAEHQAALASKMQTIEAFIAKANAAAQTSLENNQPLPESPESLYSEETKAELAKLREDLASLEKNPPELPAAMGVVEDEVKDVAVHVRGNPARLGDVIARHVPPVMVGPEPALFNSEHSGRMELANWLVSPQHPLTARVLVNRFWRWHFGEGLVRSPDNFGLPGEKPTHPELLDWLAQRFIADGWSLKTFHRLILNSSTYQQSSVVSAESRAGDPDNLCWSRFPMRRLSAEEVRDAMLFVSGTLDQTMGGSLLKVKNRGYLFDHTSIDTTDYRSHRRSLYLPVIRNNVFDLFQLLDFPDPAVPNGNRTTTTVAPQALLMMNSDFVIQAADDLAQRVSGAGHKETAIERLYFLTLGRAPSPTELADDVNLLQTAITSNSIEGANATEADRTLADAELHAWSLLCQVLLASSEFLYVQ